MHACLSFIYPVDPENDNKGYGARWNILLTNEEDGMHKGKGEGSQGCSIALFVLANGRLGLLLCLPSEAGL
jgi:hypothetical protein